MFAGTMLLNFCGERLILLWRPTEKKNVRESGEEISMTVGRLPDNFRRKFHCLIIKSNEL